MEIEVHDSAHRPRRLRCTRIIVRDEHGHPQVAVMSPAPGQIWVTNRGDVGWDRALRAMGIEDTSVTHVVAENELPPPPGKLVLPGIDFMG